MQKVKLLTQLTKARDVKIIDLAKKLGVQSSYICHLLRLNRLPDTVLDGYYSNSISLSHLFIISRIKDPAKIIEIYEKVLAGSLTVKATEELVRDTLFGIKTVGDYLNSTEKDDIVGKITGSKKNLKINIIQTRIKSKVIFEIKGDLDSTSREVRQLLKSLELR